MRALHVLGVGTVLISVVACANVSRVVQVDAPQGTVVPTPVTKMTEGEVRKIDKASGMMTLRSGPIENLKIPAKTMMFAVTDPRMLDTFKKGDTVLFSADLVGGKIAVTHIELAK